MRGSARLPALLAVLLGTIVLGSAVPLGGFRLWISLPITLLCAALSVLALGIALRDRRFLNAGGPGLGAVVPLALLLVAWFWLQTVSWLPAFMWNPVYAIADLAPGSVAVHPEVSRQFVLRMVAYMMVFWVATRVGADHRLAQGLLIAAALATAAMAVFAIHEYRAGSLTIFGIEKRAGIAATGTFESPNTYASYAAIGLCCALAVFAAPISGVTRISGKRDTRKAVVLRICMAMCGGCNLLAIVLSESRAGLGLAVVAFLTFGATYLAGQRWRALAGAGIVAAATAGTVALIAIGSAFHTSSVVQVVLGNRALQLRSVWDVAGFYGPGGVGLGGFADAAAARKPPGMLDYHWDAAHNTFVEHVVEMGWFAAPVFWLLLMLVAGRLVLGLADRRRDRHFAAVALTVFVLELLHGAVDYPLHRPGVALLFAMIAGLGWAQSHSSKPSRDGDGAGETGSTRTVGGAATRT
ncbi:MAG: O-antigen ligase family protein [Pseudomonadota bacterium]|nr:O-antigen ligase family protein [Pseudomonadota bacterium]